MLLFPSYSCFSCFKSCQRPLLFFPGLTDCLPASCLAQYAKCSTGHRAVYPASASSALALLVVFTSNTLSLTPWNGLWPDPPGPGGGTRPRPRLSTSPRKSSWSIPSLCIPTCWPLLLVCRVRCGMPPKLPSRFSADGALAGLRERVAPVVRMGLLIFSHLRRRSCRIRLCSSSMIRWSRRWKTTLRWCMLSFCPTMERIFIPLQPR